MGTRCSHCSSSRPSISVPPSSMDEQQPQCAAAAMMHGISRPPASSCQGGCPTIAEHQEYVPPAPLPRQLPMAQEMILPNPGYKIPSNLWNLDVSNLAWEGPVATFLRHCNTMESPYNPTYSKGSVQPLTDIHSLQQQASMENLRDLQKYSEQLIFESTCCRPWSEGIQNQIMDEQEKVQTMISGMTDELIRLKRTHPAWINQLQAQRGATPPQMSMSAPSSQPPQQASSSSTSTVMVKPAPMSKSSSTASTPDPWAAARMRQPRQ